MIAGGMYTSFCFLLPRISSHLQGHSPYLLQVLSYAISDTVAVVQQLSTADDAPSVCDSYKSCCLSYS